MSAQIKGLLGVVLGINSVFPVIFFEIFSGGPGMFWGVVVPTIFAVMAYKLGRQAKNDGATVLGTLAVGLGIVGIIIWAGNIFSILIASL